VTTSLADVQRAFTRICFELEAPEEDLALLNPPRERWLMYRRMVRSRLFGMCRNGLPRTVEVLGEPAFNAAVKRYLAEHGPRTRFIREVVDELVAHSEPAWTADADLPPHVCDLARYEATKWRVSSAEWTTPEPTADELDFEGVPVHNPTVAWTEVRHAVHRKDAQRDAPLDAPRRVLVHRKPDDPKIYALGLGPEGAALYDAWREPDRSFADGVKAHLAAVGRAPDAAFVDRMATVLTQLVERQIILGSRR